MSAKLYKNEMLWRGIIAADQSAIRTGVHTISETIAAALLIYLASIYSVPIAFALAVGLMAVLVWLNQRSARHREQFVTALEGSDEPDPHRGVRISN